MTGTDVHIETVGRLTTISLDRPQRLNALSASFVSELVRAFDRAHADPDTWVVLLRAEGDRAFCVGRDLKEVADNDAARTANDSMPMRGPERNVFEVIAECSKPVVVALFGHTLGGGAELALAADVRIAASDLAFGFPEVTRGFGANFASVMLPRIVGPGPANDLLFTGRPADAEELLRLGLVNQVVAPDELDQAARRYAELLTENAPLTLRRYKAMSVKSQGLPLAAALRLDAAPDPYTSEDRREGVAAFLERRAPRWSAR